MSSSRAGLAVLVLVAVLGGFAQAQAASNSKPTNKDEEEVAQLEHDWLAADAKADFAWFEKTLADDFVGAAFDGPLLNKRDIIPPPGKPGGFAGATPSDTSVRIFGDTAVLMGFIKVADPQFKQIRVTLVCQKRAEGWQMIAAHLARM